MRVVGFSKYDTEKLESALAILISVYEYNCGDTKVRRCNDWLLTAINNIAEIVKMSNEKQKEEGILS